MFSDKGSRGDKKNTPFAPGLAGNYAPVSSPESNLEVHRDPFSSQRSPAGCPMPRQGSSFLNGCGWCGCVIAEPKTGRCAACMQVFRAVFGGWAFVTLFVPWSLLAMAGGL